MSFPDELSPFSSASSQPILSRSRREYKGQVSKDTSLAVSTACGPVASAVTVNLNLIGTSARSVSGKTLESKEAQAQAVAPWDGWLFKVQNPLVT